MADTQNDKTKRELMLERLRSKYPDQSFDDDEAVFDRIYADYDDYDKGKAMFDEQNSAFEKMFSADPRSARILTDWRKGDDPAIALVRLYGNEIKEAIDDPEKQEQIAEANREYMERVAKEKEYETLYTDNLAKSLKDMDEIQAERGLSDDDMDKAMGWLIGIAKDAMLGKFTTETIDFALKACNHDEDVNNAQAQGEVKGRNSRITEDLRKPKRGDGTAVLDGKNGGSGNARPMPDLGALDNYGAGNTSIFERGGEKRTPLRSR